MKTRILVTAFTLAAVTSALAQEAAKPAGVDPRPPNATGQTPAFPGQTRAPERKSNVAFDVVTVAEGLQNPWGLTFLPGGKLLVTEKPGRLRIVGADGKLSEPVAGLPAVDARNQGGLLDVTLDPRFASNRLDLLDLCRAAGRRHDEHRRRSRPARGRCGGAEGGGRAGHLPSDAVHGLDAALRRPHGVGPRRDACSSRSATVPSLKGACSRSGWTACSARSSASTPTARSRKTIPSSARKASGRRSGRSAIATCRPRPRIRRRGELWEVEHGTRGGDEINISRKGKDYGWPTIAYGIEYAGTPITGGITAKEGMEQPRYYWDPVIAPSGMVFYTGNLFPAWKGNLFIGGHGQHQSGAAHRQGRPGR